ncbi:MAG: bifunctional adenosylcobinamide kinase/adenosylcobinamide-phosphate guanylyltransferase [Nocardioidaceae bacterium]|nr:bifunctional adenosylcobinamide kinase/adenosylcobinamide-phosphate guanylyltransferase [Nocardioidaceae bacterium]
MTARRVLVTGGVRSGKSRHAEGLFEPDEPVVYVAPGPSPDGDPEWAERVSVHRARRPSAWSTVETTDVAAAVRDHPGPLLLDCLGTWVTAVLDELDAWEAPRDVWSDEVDARVEDLAAAWSDAPGVVVAVTNEVGMGVVPAHRSGRVFRDVLGTVNQRVAAASDEVALVVAGRVLHL